MDVIVVCEEKIDAALSVHALQFVEKADEIAAERVVAVDGLEVFAGGVAQALIDAFAVPAVLLMDDPYDAGILRGVRVGDGAGIVFGAVVNDDDLHPVAAGEKAFDALVHVVLRIVAGHGNGQQFHTLSSFMSDKMRRLFRDFRPAPARTRSPRPCHSSGILRGGRRR